MDVVDFGLEALLRFDVFIKIVEPTKRLGGYIEHSPGEESNTSWLFWVPAVDVGPAGYKTLRYFIGRGKIITGTTLD